MGLKKGQTNNPKGRPKGAENKVTSEMKQWISDLIEGNRALLERDFLDLDPYRRWCIIEKLMQYTTPKAQSIHHFKEVLGGLSDEEKAILDGIEE